MFCAPVALRAVTGRLAYIMNGPATVARPPLPQTHSPCIFIHLPGSGGDRRTFLARLSRLFSFPHWTDLTLCNVHPHCRRKNIYSKGESRCVCFLAPRRRERWARAMRFVRTDYTKALPTDAASHLCSLTQANTHTWAIKKRNRTHFSLCYCFLWVSSFGKEILQLMFSSI